MRTPKNTVALYVDKDLVNIYKASLDMYEALKAVLTQRQDLLDTGKGSLISIVEQALAKAEDK